MKKLLLMMLTLILIFSMGGCGNNTAVNSYTSGTYTGTGYGMKGKILLDVTFTQDSIDSISVKSMSETAYLSDKAFERIPAAIVENQSLDIDTVSGATMSSNGILNAVADAVTQAGGDPKALKDKTVEIKASDPIENTYDVVVVGGGGAGLAAAISAAEEGSSVLIIEKAAYLGGNTLVAGKVFNSADPQVQKKTEMDDSLKSELEGYMSLKPDDFGDFKDIVITVQKQIREYFDSGETYLFDTPELHIMQWYIGGMRTGLDDTTIKPDLDLVSEIAYDGLDTLDWMKQHGVTVSDSTFTVLGALWPRTHAAFTQDNGSIIGTFEKQILSLGVDVLYETKAEHLIMEDGRVTGVKSVKTDGTEVTSYANNGVILTTGGFAANAAMVKEYDNYWGDYVTDKTKSTNVGTATGDGINMAKEIGANLVGMGYSQMMPSSHPVTGTMTDGIWGSAESQVFVNSEGIRYVNEYAERDVLSKAALEQKDGLFYIICDNDILKSYKVDELLAMEEAGNIYYADTLEELAQEMGVPADTFVSEMEKYNSYVDDQKDPDFGKSNFGGEKIDNGPFCATPRSPSLHHTMGGVEINTDAQVIDTSEKVIPGLYAAGEVTGGIHAGNRLGGNATADIMVFGRIAGTNAAKGNK